jgi:uncharacterized membrane protein required for colicin V production
MIFSFAFNGMRLGLVKSVFNLFSSFVSIILTGFLYRPVANFIREKTNFYNIFLKFIQETLAPIVKNNIENIQKAIKNNLIENAGKSIGDLKINIVDTVKLPGILKNDFVSKFFEKINIENFLNTDSLVSFIYNSLAIFLLNIMAMAITFFIISLIISIISRILDIISFIPGLNTTNRSLGLAMGFFQAAITIWILCLILGLFIENPSLIFLKNMLNNSRITKIFYDNNLILKYFSMFLKINT